MLSIDNVSMRYGDFVAVDGVTMAVENGAMVGLIGPNGAGKSTLFSLISGFSVPSTGQIRLQESDITRSAPELRAVRGLGRTFQVPREFGSLTVRENFFAAAPGQSGETLFGAFFKSGAIARENQIISAKIDRLLALLKLGRVADVISRNLSGGQKKLLELGRALMLDPQIILLDEPFAGLNPVMIEELCEFIKDLNRGGVAILIIDHNIQAITSIAPKLYVMDRGAIIASGNPIEVLDNEAVIEAYIGRRAN